MQQMSYYTVVCDRYFSRGYGEIWLHLIRWPSPAGSVFYDIFIGSKLTIPERIYSDTNQQFWKNCSWIFWKDMPSYKIWICPCWLSFTENSFYGTAQGMLLVCHLSNEWHSTQLASVGYKLQLCIFHGKKYENIDSSSQYSLKNFRIRASISHVLSQIIIDVNQISFYSRANLIVETLREHRINMLSFFLFVFLTKH